ncbi:MAG: VWA domain-containing protein [Sedimentisphaerales bacterium]|nr:VWA domain-containing protein [Sedimentisphaerales bacterium]
MIFTRPWLLLLLAVPVVLGYLSWVLKGHPLLLPFDHGKQKKGRFLRICINILNLLPALLLAVAIVFWAGPRQLAPPKEERVLTNTIFCLDVSGSMGSVFGSQESRYDSAMKAINEFIEYRQGDAFGLTIFGNEVLHWTPVTKDTAAIALATPFLQPGKLPYWFGGTSIGKALLACRDKMIQTEEGDRMIILVTDGMSSDLYGGRDYDIGQQLKDDKIVVYVIVVGDQIRNEMDTIASITHGDTFQAGDPLALKAIFRHIDAMQKSRFKKGAPSLMDDFGLIALTGLALLGAQVLALFGLRYTPW